MNCEVEWSGVSTVTHSAHGGVEERAESNIYRSWKTSPHRRQLVTGAPLISSHPKGSPFTTALRLYVLVTAITTLDHCSPLDCVRSSMLAIYGASDLHARRPPLVVRLDVHMFVSSVMLT